MRKNKTTIQGHNLYTMSLLSIAALLLVTATLPAAITAQLNYNQFWHQKIKPTQGDFFMHTTYQPKADLSGSLATTVQQLMAEELQKSLSQGKLKLDPSKQLTVSNKANAGYTSLHIQQDVLAEYTDRANQGFKEFLDYVDRPDLMPNLDFRLLDANTKFQPPTTDSATMYLAWNKNTRVWSWLHYEDQKDQLLTRRIDAPDPIRGQLVGQMVGSFDQATGVTLENQMHHAYGGLGYSPISSYAIPMSELFPLFLRPITAKFINKEINETWTKQGRPIAIDKNHHQSVIKKWDIREDSLLEALIDEFIGTKLNQLGFTETDWQKYSKHGNSNQYALSPKVKNKIKNLGAPEVLRLYIEQPEKLF